MSRLKPQILVHHLPAKAKQRLAHVDKQTCPEIDAEVGTV